EHAAGAQDDPSVGRAHLDNRRRGAHHGKQARRQEEAGQSHHERYSHPQRDGLHGGHRRALGILLAGAARHHSGSGETQAHGDGHDEGQQRLGESNGGHGVRSQARHPENVHHGEQRLHRHLQHHGDGQQKNGTVDADGGIVLVGAAKGLADRGPKTRRRLTLGHHSSFSCFHWGTYGSRPKARGRARSSPL